MLQVRLEIAATIAGAMTALFTQRVKTRAEVISELAVGILAGLFIGPGVGDLLKVEDATRRISICYVVGLVVFGVIRQIVRLRDRVGRTVARRLEKIVGPDTGDKGEDAP
jgi:ABC-type Mn2+/Zn2+ transport system permease subunit